MLASVRYCGLRIEADCNFERDEIEPTEVTVYIDATDEDLPYRITQAIWRALERDLSPLLWAEARLNLSLLNAP